MEKRQVSLSRAKRQAAAAQSSDRQNPTPTDSHRPWITTAAGIGTLLTGIAAIGTLAVTALGISDPSGASDASTELGRPQLPTVRGFDDLDRQIGQVANDRLTQDVNTPGPSYSQWTADDGRVEVVLPDAWEDVETVTWLDDQGRAIGAAVVGAATDVDGLYDGWTTSGLFVGASPNTVAPQALLDARAESRDRNCTDEGVGDFDGDGYEGRYALWSQCGGHETVAVDLAANHRSDPGTLWLHLRLTSGRDLAAASEALETLEVDLVSVADEFERTTGQRRAPGQVVP